MQLVGRPSCAVIILRVINVMHKEKVGHANMKRMYSGDPRQQKVFQPKYRSTPYGGQVAKRNNQPPVVWQG